jgi:hypothetical protein
MTTISVPNFKWTAFYYPQILEALIADKRINCPEHTDESPQDPLIQTLRAMALVGHLNSCDIDMVANESTLPTAKLPEVVRNMLRLIGYELSPANPASADIVCKLTAALAASTQVLSAFAQVATRATLTEKSVPFEFLEALGVAASANGFLTAVFALESSVYTDYTLEANTGPSASFVPWATPAAGDMLYVGHSGVMWDKLGVTLKTGGSGLTGIWEYYDGDVLTGKPGTKVVDGGTLVFGVNSILGTAKRVGTIVRVQLDSSGAYEECVSVWESGENKIHTTTLLGQTVSEANASDVNDYTVGTEWKELTTTDSTSNWNAGGSVSYTLPESLTQQWNKCEVNGIEAYWLRYRLISVSGPASPEIYRLRIDQGGQYVKAVAVQGQRQIDSNIGTGDGVTAGLTFATSQEGFIDGSDTVTVAGTTWARVTNFLQSVSTDRHYRVVLGENDKASIKFGDGVTGAIPSGVVSVTYRKGANDNGNVGAGTIVADKSGLAVVNTLWNPRPAIGWQESDVASEESLEIAKVRGPASLRISEVALGPDDVELLTLEYENEAGARPFIRACAIEGGLALPKTIILILAVSGAGVASAEQLEEIQTYFNGDDTALPPVRKRLVANQEVLALNYQRKIVDIEATVYGAVSISAIEAVIAALLQPDAKKADGINFEWSFGGDVYLSRIYHEIFAADPSIYRVTGLKINGSASDLTLSAYELPVAGSIAIVEG